MQIVAVADTHTFERDLRAIPEGDVFIANVTTRERGPTVLDIDPTTHEVIAVSVPPARVVR